MSSITEQIPILIISIMMIIFPKEKPIMNIRIDKLGIDNDIYEKGSINNNIDKNVIILNDSDYPDKINGTVLIGAHSGVGKEAYFKNLDKLKNGDKIKITYKDKLYLYKIDNISKDTKDGKIRIEYNNNRNRLILYTCYPHDKNNYLVISSYLSK